MYISDRRVTRKVNVSEIDRLMSLKECADAPAGPRVSVRTMRQWVADGHGPHAFRVGARVFVRESDWNRWLEALHAAGTGGADA